MVKKDINSWILIGCGYIAHHYAHCLINLFPDDSFYVIAKSKSSESYLSFSRRFQIFKYIELSEIKKIDNIIPIICTPVSNHFKIINHLLENDVENIYCEKPLSLEAKEIEILRKYEKNIFVLFNRRFYEINKFIDTYKENAIALNARIGINKSLPTWKDSFLPHFIDFIIFKFPIEGEYNIDVFSRNFKFISYQKKNNINKLMPIHVQFFDNILIPCSIEIILDNGKIIKLETLEKLVISEHEIIKSSLMSNKIECKDLLIVNEESNDILNAKFGFVNMLRQIKSGDNKNMHTIDDASRILEIIDNL